MNKAILLDRDGVVNIERGDYTYNIDDFEFVDGIIESMKLFQNAGFLLIIITNQGGINKKIYTLSEMELLHNYMIKKLEENKVNLAEIYVCPHHSDIEKCICRKPDSLLIEKAIYNFNIDVKKSFFIGDRKTDIEAAMKTGVKGILVEENQNIIEIANDIIIGK